jgi:hypothetical protein
VIPADAVVLSAEGEGITKWQQNGARLEVTLRDRTHTLALTTRVRSVIDLQSDTKPQSLALPTLRFAGQLATDPQARIGSIAEGVTLMAYEGATPQQNGVIHWNPVRDTLKLLLRKADPRIVVDADAHISVTHDDRAHRPHARRADGSPPSPSCASRCPQARSSSAPRPRLAPRWTGSAPVR